MLCDCTLSDAGLFSDKGHILLRSHPEGWVGEPEPPTDNPELQPALGTKKAKIFPWSPEFLRWEHENLFSSHTPFSNYLASVADAGVRCTQQTQMTFQTINHHWPGIYDKQQLTGICKSEVCRKAQGGFKNCLKGVDAKVRLTGYGELLTAQWALYNHCARHVLLDHLILPMICEINMIIHT